MESGLFIHRAGEQAQIAHGVQARGRGRFQAWQRRGGPHLPNVQVSATTCSPLDLRDLVLWPLGAHSIWPPWAMVT